MCCIIWNPRNTNYYCSQMFWTISYHHSKQNYCGIRSTRKCRDAIEQILWNERRRFWRSSPRWWEISDPLHTNSIDRLCTQPYHNPVRKGWRFLPWLVGQLEFENLCLFYCWLKESSQYQKSSKYFAYYCVYFLTTTTLHKIWLSGKFHPVLCVKQEILKINFASREILNRYFCEDNNHASGFMVDLAMECYHEHPTMVGELICRSWFFGVRTLSLASIS